MIRHIFRFLARLVTSLRRPDPPGLPADEALQLRQAMHHAGPVVDDPDEYEMFGYGLWH